MARRKLARAFLSAVAAFVFPDAEIMFDQTLGVVRLGAQAKAGGHILVRETDQSVNVRYFGVAGDGVTDDSDAIKAADAYATEEGRALYFPKGRYAVRPNVIFRAGCPWHGQGKNISIICALPGQIFPHLSGLVSCQQKEGCSTSKMGFDLTGGIYPEGTGNPGNIYWAANFQLCEEWEWDDCKIKGIGPQRIGLAIDGGTLFEIKNSRFFATPSPKYNQAINISFASGLATNYTLRDIVMRGSGYLTNGSDGTHVNCQVTGWQFGGGMTFGPNIGCQNHYIEACRAVGGSGMDINGVHPAGFELWGAYIEIVNCYSAYNAGSGYGGGGFGVKGRGNTALNNGQISGFGIELVSIIHDGVDYGSSRSSWIGNTLIDTQPVPTQKYGYAEYILTGSAMGAVNIDSNIVYGNKNGNYLFTPGQRSFRGSRLSASAAGTLGAIATVAQQTVPVAGVRRGDIVSVAYSADTTGFIIWANVDVDNNVAIRVQNVAAGSPTFPAGSWTIAVEKTPNSAGY